jgi:hypothetical protein
MEGVLGSSEPEYSEQTDAAVQSALSKLRAMLYEGDVADGLAEAVLAAPTPVEGVVDQAIALLGVAEESFGDSIPDEGFLFFGIGLMGEVVEIAQAGGVELSGRDIADAVREFLLQTVRELGGDTTQVEEAMQAISPDDVAAELDAGAP